MGPFQRVATAWSAVLVGGLVVLAAFTGFGAGCRAPAGPGAARCEAGAGSAGPGPSLSPDRRDSLPPDDDTLYLDGRWAQLARELPGGFAGYYVDPDPAPAGGGPDAPPPRERVVVLLARPAEREEALRALQARLGTMQYESPRDLSDARVVPARWDFAQLHDWHRYLDGQLLGLPGVQSSDVDEVANRIEYGVLSEEARRAVLARLAALGGPCGLVGVHLEGPIQPGAPPG